MSKYNTYAKQLDAAFKQTREQYKTAYEAVQSARTRHEDARGESAKMVAMAGLKDAENNFQAVNKTAWRDFEQTVQDITRELKAELHRDFSVRAADVAPNAIALLNSGVMKAADFESIIGEFQDNPTMLRLIRKKALDAARDLDYDPDERARLHTLAAAAGAEDDAILERWGSLVSASTRFSGSSMASAPAYRVQMADKWETVQQAIETF